MIRNACYNNNAAGCRRHHNLIWTGWRIASAGLLFCPFAPRLPLSALQSAEIRAFPIFKVNIYREREQNARTCEKPCFMRFSCVFVCFCALPFSAFFAPLLRKSAPRLPLRCPRGASDVQCPTDPERKKAAPLPGILQTTKPPRRGYHSGRGVTAGEKALLWARVVRCRSARVRASCYHMK